MILQWAFKTRKYGLPHQGSWMDQPAGLITQMEAALAVYDAVKAWKDADDWKTWSEKHPDLWEVVQVYIQIADHARKRLKQ